MFEYWRTSVALKKARRLRARLNEATSPCAMSDRLALIRTAQRLKKIFLATLEKGETDKLARLYKAGARSSALPVANKKPRLSPDLAIECLQELRQMFVQSPVKPFLVSGTFLGCVREQRLLAHDYDIDLGVNLADEFLPGLLADLKRHPSFELQEAQVITNEMAALNDWAKGRAGKPWLVKFLFKKAIHLDLFVHISHRGEVFHGSKKNLWVNAEFGLAPRPFYGLEFYAPANAEVYLTENYGDWVTPVRSFDCTTDTPNARVIHTTSALKFLIKQHILTGRLGDDRRQAILLRRIQQCFAALE